MPWGDGVIWPIRQRREWKKVPGNHRKFKKNLTISSARYFQYWLYPNKWPDVSKWRLGLLCWVQGMFQYFCRWSCTHILVEITNYLGKSGLQQHPRNFNPPSYFDILWYCMLSVNPVTLGTQCVHRGRDSIQISCKSDEKYGCYLQWKAKKTMLLIFRKKHLQPPEL